MPHGVSNLAISICAGRYRKHRVASRDTFVKCKRTFLVNVTADVVAVLISRGVDIHVPVTTHPYVHWLLYFFRLGVRLKGCLMRVMHRSGGEI